MTESEKTDSAPPGDAPRTPTYEPPEELRDDLRAESGAPSAGRALRDVFSTDEIFQRILASAEEEIDRPGRLLLFSGIAAGLSIGATFLARAALTGLVSSGQASFIGNLLYPVGFILIVIGRYQLFTENTLTPVTLVLTRTASVPRLLRLWGIALAGNLLGVGTIALLSVVPSALTPEAAEAARAFGEHALSIPAAALLIRAQTAGFIVASMVWLVHAARTVEARFWIVYLLMLMIPTADLFHCIVGFCEVFYLVLEGAAGVGEAARFFGLVILGNTFGGVVFVALLNFGQTANPRLPASGEQRRVLSWREFLLGGSSSA